MTPPTFSTKAEDSDYRCSRMRQYWSTLIYYLNLNLKSNFLDQHQPTSYSSPCAAQVLQIVMKQVVDRCALITCSKIITSSWPNYGGVPWRQGFRHPTRNECMGWFAQIPNYLPRVVLPWLAAFSYVL